MEVGGKGDYIPIATLSPPLRISDSCIKMGSDKSHFNVSLIVRDKVKPDSVHRPQLLKRKERGSGIEQGKTGSHYHQGSGGCPEYVSLLSEDIKPYIIIRTLPVVPNMSAHQSEH